MYYWVNQGKTFKEEKEGGYLWAPFKDKNGRSVFHWDNMDKLKPSDVVFNYYKGKVLGYCVIKSNCYDFSRPNEYSEEVEWEGTGRMIDADYVLFDTPIDINAEYNKIKHLLPTKYSPLNDNARANQGYLYSIPDNLATKLFEFANIRFDTISKVEEPETSDEYDIPDITSRSALVISRVVQGKYRRKILKRWNNRCAVTKSPLIEILIASHILPWREANNFQRLDVNNGILLSPTYDALFDKHYISFDDDGKIILSDIYSISDFNVLGVTGDEKINNLTPENIEYLKLHRKKILKKT